jgi:hypothetical protein
VSDARGSGGEASKAGMVNGARGANSHITVIGSNVTDEMRKH